ncbi:U3 small nucleolar RNA-interacting protein 2-like [Palaemon carinicauda]|uniref:U3 small nucleolar RNA-interacting protein 2-like n=1 Tax=Palaemon carinicauda TaxID=392227 RepID=UPI0035B5CD54
MPFFIRGRVRDAKEKKGKKRGLKNKQALPTKKSKLDSGLDEEITSEEDEEYLKGKVNDAAEEKGVEDLETAQEKKVRLARQYIQELRQQKENEDDEELDDKAVAARLQEEVLDSAGKLRRLVAETYLEPELEDIIVLKSKHQKLPITCLAVTSDGQFIYSGSKDCSIVKYSIDGKRLGHIAGGRKGTEKFHVGHTSHIYSLAVSTDGKFLASGDVGGFIHVWNGETLEHLKKFKSHRSAVSALAFRRSSHTLYSASHDRMVMVWDLDTMAFVEHLGGHQDAITGIDSLVRESCITSGGRDQSVIVYVIVEDKQLRFVSPHDSIDGVKLVDERTFVTFGQEGSLGIWTTLKKRPHFMVRRAHGCQAENGLPNWICSVSALVNTDVVASGSMDGYIRLWKITVDRGQRKLQSLFNIPIAGVVNDLAFTSNGSHLIAGIGQEHKLGRWFKDKTAKNSIIVIPLKKNV